MITLDVEQGSPEWQRARLGIPTASEFARILTPTKLTRSTQAGAYIDRCVAEWVSGQADSEFMGDFWTDRGAAYEAEARAWFELTTGYAVESVGFCWRDDGRDVGCSPDGLVRTPPPGDGWQGHIGGLELKVPKLSTHIGYLRSEGVPSRYWLQVQGCLWVTQLPRWWWMSYSPVPNMPSVLREVEPDVATQAALDDVMPEVIEQIDAMKSRLLLEGVKPAEPGDMGAEWEPAEAAF